MIDLTKNKQKLILKKKTPDVSGVRTVYCDDLWKCSLLYHLFQQITSIYIYTHTHVYTIQDLKDRLEATLGN